MKKCLIFITFLFANPVFATECTPQELDAMNRVQEQLAAFCTLTNDFTQTPDRCKNIAQRRISQETCSAIKAKIEHNNAQFNQKMLVSGKY